jgi:hypothetical protein
LLTLSFSAISTLEQHAYNVLFVHNVEVTVDSSTAVAVALTAAANAPRRDITTFAARPAPTNTTAIIAITASFNLLQPFATSRWRDKRYWQNYIICRI